MLLVSVENCNIQFVLSITTSPPSLSCHHILGMIFPFKSWEGKEFYELPGLELLPLSAPPFAFKSHGCIHKGMVTELIRGKVN